MADAGQERGDERVVALQQVSVDESKDQAARVGVPYVLNTLRDAEKAVPAVDDECKGGDSLSSR